MQYLVTAEEMRRYDTNTIETLQVPGMVLMERAALAVRERIGAYLTGKTDRVLILAGVGNNGGDGLALARLLVEQGVEVCVWCVGNREKASEQWRQQRAILEHYEVEFCDRIPEKEYTILVDALFGVGLSRAVEGVYAEAVQLFNGKSGVKIAVDVPSGLDSDTGRVLGVCVRADETVTFGFIKRGLILYPGREYAGNLVRADVGIDRRAFLGKEPTMFCQKELGEALRGSLDSKEISRGCPEGKEESLWFRMPHRVPYGNKGTFGKVLVVAGDVKMAGAAVLCTKAALQSGVGMAKVITAPENREILQNSVPEAMLGTWEDLEQSFSWANVIVIGPGLGKSEKAFFCLEKVIRKSSLPVVIDADGLNLLAQSEELIELLSAQERLCILTPHVGELSRLTGKEISELKEALWEHGKALAGRFHAVVAAKDARTFVCGEEGPVFVNIRGNSGMATAGSGDVLAGAIAGILAQLVCGADDGKGEAVTAKECGERKLPAKQAWMLQGKRSDAAFRAACLGVHFHALAGERAAKRYGEYACTAGKIAESLALPE